MTRLSLCVGNMPAVSRDVDKTKSRLTVEKVRAHLREYLLFSLICSSITFQNYWNFNMSGKVTSRESSIEKIAHYFRIGTGY